MPPASFLTLDSFVRYAKAHPGSYRTLSQRRPFTMEIKDGAVVFRPSSGQQLNPELPEYIERFNKSPSFRPSDYAAHLWSRSYFVTIAAAMLGEAQPESKGQIGKDLELPGPTLEKKIRELRKRGTLGIPKGQAQPPKVRGTVAEFARDPAVKAWVLEEAQGRCELCTGKAPFKDDRGLPFLELHHVHSLAEGGPDTIANSVALCPNCHRACHLSRARQKLTAKLYRQCARLVRTTPLRAS